MYDDPILKDIVNYLNNNENYKNLIDIFFDSDKDNSMKIEKQELINILKKFNLNNDNNTKKLLELISKNEDEDENKYKNKNFFELNDIIELGCIMDISNDDNFSNLANYLIKYNLLDEIKNANNKLYKKLHTNIQNYIKENKLKIYFKNPKFNILEKLFLEEIHNAIGGNTSIEYDNLIENLEKIEKENNSSTNLGLSKILRALI